MTEQARYAALVGAARAATDPRRYDRCSGEGHGQCVGFSQPTERWPHGVVSVYPRGTPSCIWNVAAMYGPGSGERHALRAVLERIP
jgi:hypothetical protein